MLDVLARYPVVFGVAIRIQTVYLRGGAEGFGG